ncbi:DUF2147 domain-containing protein [Microvirga brassicacearum]|uniref:DUF2147 domain-containing protein n=1 Tax=Microvirga brassicacearum TaxID=2580413 RepID=A0A5N3PIE4_9HYPH|nr:DUF2147 domain-containing protein [Microvirga brassicacearum]KAB0269498.1 DUF2147 domain-containing protein [Microvirga brassicacearum]
MRFATIMALGAILFATSAPAQQSFDPSGTYVSQSGRTRVRVSRCGAAHCGRIVSVVGETKDVNNPDPAKRGRNLVGLEMMWDVRPARGGYTGQLYNFRDGKIYAGKATFDGDAMKVSGCVLAGLICRTQTWRRAN